MTRNRIDNSKLEKISIGQKVRLVNVHSSEENTFYGGVKKIDGSVYAYFYNKMNEETIALTLFCVSDIYARGNQIFF